jgi:hypothetical protein
MKKKNYSRKKKNHSRKKKGAKTSQKAGSSITKESINEILSKKDSNKPFIVYFFTGYGCKASSFKNDLFQDCADLIKICYDYRYNLLKILLGSKKIELDNYLFKVLQHIIQKSLDGKIVYLFGYSFGGAIVNFLYEEIIKRYYSNDKYDPIPLNKIIITAYGSIYLSNMNLITDNIVLTNYMDINDFYVSKERIMTYHINKGIKVPEYNSSKSIISSINTTLLYNLVEKVNNNNNTIIWIRLYNDEGEIFNSKTEEDKFVIHIDGYMIMINNYITPDGNIYNSFIEESKKLSITTPCYQYEQKSTKPTADTTPTTK